MFLLTDWMEQPRTGTLKLRFHYGQKKQKESAQKYFMIFNSFYKRFTLQGTTKKWM